MTMQAAIFAAKGHNKMYQTLVLDRIIPLSVKKTTVTALDNQSCYCMTPVVGQ